MNRLDPITGFGLRGAHSLLSGSGAGGSLLILILHRVLERHDPLQPDEPDATQFAAQQIGHRWPDAIPGTERFLFYAGGPPDTAGIYLGTLGDTAGTRLTAAASAGVYHPDGWLLWMRDGALAAQRLDVARAAMVGDAVTVADEVAVGIGGVAHDAHVGVRDAGQVEALIAGVHQLDAARFAAHHLALDHVRVAARERHHHRCSSECGQCQRPDHPDRHSHYSEVGVALDSFPASGGAGA